MTERRADEATREVSDWLKYDFMQDQVGNTFSGVIASVTGLASSSPERSVYRWSGTCLLTG